MCLVTFLCQKYVDHAAILMNTVVVVRSSDIKGKSWLPLHVVKAVQNGTGNTLENGTLILVYKTFLAWVGGFS